MARFRFDFIGLSCWMRAEPVCQTTGRKWSSKLAGDHFLGGRMMRLTEILVEACEVHIGLSGAFLTIAERRMMGSGCFSQADLEVCRGCARACAPNSGRKSDLPNRAQSCRIQCGWEVWPSCWGSVGIRLGLLPGRGLAGAELARWPSAMGRSSRKFTGKRYSDAYS